MQIINTLISAYLVYDNYLLQYTCSDNYNIRMRMFNIMHINTENLAWKIIIINNMKLQHPHLPSIQHLYEKVDKISYNRVCLEYQPNHNCS